MIVTDSYRSSDLKGLDFGESAAPVAQMHEHSACSSL